MENETARLNYLQIFADKRDLLAPFSREDKGELLEAMMAYAFDCTEMTLETNARFIWPVFKQMIDQSRETYARKSAAGKQGGRPGKQTEADESGEKQKKTDESESPKNQETRDKSQETDIDSLPAGRERARARFVPPSADEVAAYCREKGYAIRAEAFVDYYASKGWRVGNTPMKDWRAAVRTWATRDAEPRPMPARGPKVVHEQLYPQREYTDNGDDLLRAQMAEYLAAEKGESHGRDPDRGLQTG